MTVVLKAAPQPNDHVAPDPPRWYRSDALAITVLVVLCVAAAMLRWVHTDWMSGYDGFDDFLPDWGYLGDRLRQFDVPGWNPYYSSGTPFAGDPGTGWMYLPIMLCFTLLPALTAWKSLILVMSLTCGIAAYLFTRRIGLEPLAALFASASFAIGPMTYGLATDRIAVTTTYLPIIVGLLGAEMAVRSPRLVPFLAWTALGGIGIGQNYAAWPAQGMIYTMMYVAGWLAYRWLFALPPEVTNRTAFFKRALGFGLGAGLISIAFGAAAIWPLLDVTGQSTIAGGDYSQAVNGQPVGDTSPLLNIVALLFQDSPHYRISTAGGAVVLLALFGIFCFRNRYGMPFFAVAGWIFTDIASNESLTRWLFYLVPFFEHAHAHRPTASSAFIYPALNILGGIGIQFLLDESPFRRVVRATMLGLATLGTLLVFCTIKDIQVGAWPIVITVLTALVVLVIGARTSGVRWATSIPAPRLVSLAFLVILIVYPTTLDYGRIWNGSGRTPGLDDVNISESEVDRVISKSVRRTDPGTAAEFLQQQQAQQQPFRYAAYYEADTNSGQHLPFLFRRLDPYIVTTLAGPRSGFLELSQVSAYNPVHMKYYTEYFEYMQEAQQDYHFTDVFTSALDKAQLFNMLNVKYVIVATNLSRTPPIATYGTEVYRDDMTIVYENPYVFPRAWIVHDVDTAMGGDEMKILNDYEVDGHDVAYVHGDIPANSPLPADAPVDTVMVTDYQPERITLTTISGADGLLVLSEVYAKGWKAYVDGKEVEILRTDHALRGIPLSAGSHEVVVKYELTSLRIGMWSTTLSGIGIVALWIWAGIDRRRHHSHPLPTA